MNEWLAPVFKMGGYATYVWSSYAVALITLGGNLWYSRLHKRRIEARLRQLSRVSDE